jgi:hypothetical protein
MDWCQKHSFIPESHRSFIPTLKRNLPFPIEKVNRSEGVFLKGISLKPEVINRDYTYGGKLLDENPQIGPVEIKDPEKVRVSENLYKKYFKVLKIQCPYKKNRNSKIRNYLPTIKEISEVYFEDKEEVNDEFRKHVENVIEKGILVIKRNGCIPYNYKMMGNSPRIIPVNYGYSINTTKRILRDNIYDRIATLDENYSIVDFDLKSCYTSILLGLYPKDLSALQRAIENIGLWEFIRQEFERNGVLNNYNKSAVKVCVYSSFFLGGNKAMNEGIIDSIREDVGLEKQIFKKSSMYEQAYEIARKVTDQMQNSAIIQDFRNVATYIKETYMEDYLIGPTGHKYLVDDKTFRTAYPNYLQSYEFYLLAEGVLRTLESFPDIKIIGHYHDGNTLAIPKNQKEEVIQAYNDNVEEIGIELKLLYPQKMEVKNIYERFN